MDRKMQPSRRQELLDAITQEGVRLDRLEAELGDARGRLAELRSELASLGSEAQIGGGLPLSPTPQTPAEKVKLFRSLFRGREDVFPTRFVSKRTGKPGYAPACRNKFVQGVCELPKVKCGECPNQAFIPGRRRGGPRAPDRAPRDGRLPAARRRDLLVPRRRLRQEHLDRGRERVRRDVPARRASRCGRAIALGQRRPRLVLLLRAGAGERRRARWAATSSPRRCRGGTS